MKKSMEKRMHRTSMQNIEMKDVVSAAHAVARVPTQAPLLDIVNKKYCP